MTQPVLDSKFLTSARALRHLGLVGLMMLGAVGFNRQAGAAVIYSGVVDITIPLTTDGVYLNVVTGQFSTTEFAGYHINPWSPTSLNFFSPEDPQHGFVRSNGLENFLVDNLSAGEFVDSSETSYGNGGPEVASSAAFTFNSMNYIGFRFFNPNSNAINYGWARIAVGPFLNHPSRRIVDYAYNDSGSGISVGSVPEPSSLSLLAIGSMLLFRRRKC